MILSESPQYGHRSHCSVAGVDPDCSVWEGWGGGGACQLASAIEINVNTIMTSRKQYKQVWEICILKEKKVYTSTNSRTKLHTCTC